jgi:hypothetical protein
MNATRDGWSPYLAGALVGILAVISVFLTTRVLEKTQFLGASTTFVRAAGMIESCFVPERVAANTYFTKEKIKIEWQFMLVTGIFFGALLSSLTDKSFKWESVPPVWKERFGGNAALRAIGAFAGGIVAMFGVRLADGCPSGHGLSGLMQLSISGFVALFSFFAAGIVASRLIYGGRKS